jgi:hypothetical protein
MCIKEGVSKVTICKKGIVFGLVVALSLFAAACNGSLSREEAEGLIRSSDFMAKPLENTVSLYRNRVFSADDLMAEHPEMRAFLETGLVEVRPDKVVLTVPIGAKFTLTADGVREAAGWRRTSGTNGEEAWIAVTARKELVQVSEPTGDGESAECEFSWKWAATKAGIAVGVPQDRQTSLARFRREAERWVLDEGGL